MLTPVSSNRLIFATLIMAGIYLHIPFCKKACHYCDFHFSTSRQQEEAVIAAMHREIILRKDFLSVPLSSIYFGGGTPSLLTVETIADLLHTIQQQFSISRDPEITLEANPDDVSPARAIAWKKAGINRISLGVQSFRNEWLQWMNRAHHAEQSVQAIKDLQEAGFDNISIDLIFGMPEQTLEAWKEEIQTALQFGIPHLSCYALTPEPKTALWHMIESGKTLQIDSDQQARMFLLLMEQLELAGYEHYEISNFALPGKRSRHNSAYWKRIPYLGIGPSAHSYNGVERMWNVKNNTLYRTSIEENNLPLTTEKLSPAEHWNEFIMISLRTMEGINIREVEERWGKNEADQLLKDAGSHQERPIIQLHDNHLRLTREGKLLADQIAADFFRVP
jgi:oxygen-independent coproporphyrinogen-3 oxidase